MTQPTIAEAHPRRAKATDGYVPLPFGIPLTERMRQDFILRHLSRDLNAAEQRGKINIALTNATRLGRRWNHGNYYVNVNHSACTALGLRGQIDNFRKEAARFRAYADELDQWSVEAKDVLVPRPADEPDPARVAYLAEQLNALCKNYEVAGMPYHGCLAINLGRIVVQKIDFGPFVLFHDPSRVPDSSLAHEWTDPRVFPLDPLWMRASDSAAQGKRWKATLDHLVAYTERAVVNKRTTFTKKSLNPLGPNKGAWEDTHPYVHNNSWFCLGYGRDSYWGALRIDELLSSVNIVRNLLTGGNQDLDGKKIISQESVSAWVGSTKRGVK